jgi:hypothetical protein
MSVRKHDLISKSTILHCLKFQFNKPDLVSMRLFNCRHWGICLRVVALALFLSGCATVDYQYGTGAAAQAKSLFVENSVGNPIAIGGEHPVVDRIERFVQSPRRAIRKLIGREEVDATKTEELRGQSIQLSQEYLEANGLTDVHIDVCRYEPAEQWERLKANDRIVPFWKYTGGTLNHIGYAMFPKRAFHADSYDPFTNTLNLNSTQKVNAIYYAAAAKQYRKQELLGTYEFTQHLPVIPLLHSGAVTSDAITYAQANGDWALESQLYPSCYARIGSSSLSQAATLGMISDGPFPTLPLMRLAGGSAGAATGRYVAKQREQKINEVNQSTTE